MGIELLALALVLGPSSALWQVVLPEVPEEAAVAGR